MRSWLLRETQRDTHVHIAVFVGPDADHRASAGTLILRPEEADDLYVMLAESRKRVEWQRVSLDG